MDPAAWPRPQCWRGLGPRQTDLWSSLVSHPSQIDEVEVQGGSLSQMMKWRVIQDAWHQPPASAHIHRKVHKHRILQTISSVSVYRERTVQLSVSWVLSPTPALESGLCNSCVISFYTHDCFFLYVDLYTTHVHGALEGQKRESYPLGLELKMIVSHYVGVGNCTRPSGRTASALTCWAIPFSPSVLFCR